MDIFKFNNPSNVLKMEQGEIINGITKKSWIERYKEAGDFSLTAPATSDIRTKLPIGSFISHVSSKDIMIVENHEISETSGSQPEITITGRSFESYLEQRIIGSNKTFPNSSAVKDYVIPSAVVWLQIKKLIEDHIYATILNDDNNEIPFVEIINQVSASMVPIERSLAQSDLYSSVIGLLEVDNLGIKTVRPGNWSFAVDKKKTALIIHKGRDSSKSIVFSYDSSEIQTADYFWSNRNDKNCAIINGTYVQSSVIGNQTKYNRRWMIVDGTDIDGDLQEAPVGAAYTNIINKLNTRGYAELSKQKSIAITKAEVTRNSVKAVYRIDYDLGDIVTVKGNYNEKTKQRVIEHVEIEEGYEQTAYPTLSNVD